METQQQGQLAGSKDIRVTKVSARCVIDIDFKVIAIWVIIRIQPKPIGNFTEKETRRQYIITIAKTITITKNNNLWKSRKDILMLDSFLQ